MIHPHFENLRVYQLSETLADQVWKIVLDWDHLSKDTVGKQLVRSADSVGANLAEGSGRGSDTEYRRFIRISRGSLYETRHWLRRAYKRGLLTNEQIDSLTAVISELTPTLNAYLRSIGTFKKKDQDEQQAQRPKTQNLRPKFKNPKPKPTTYRSSDHFATDIAEALLFGAFVVELGEHVEEKVCVG